MPLDQEEEINRDCLQVIEQVYATPLDLRETLTALKNPDEEFYADGSSYMVRRERKPWYAMVTITKEKEVGILPSNTSSQNAKLVALTRALELAKEKQVNIYTD